MKQETIQEQFKLLKSKVKELETRNIVRENQYQAQLKMNLDIVQRLRNLEVTR